MPYVIKEVGWVYNDSNYSPEYLGRIGRVFHDRETAESTFREWQRTYFLANIERLNELDWHDDESIDRDRNFFSEILDYLVLDLGFDPGLYLAQGTSAFNLLALSRPLTPNELDGYIDRCPIAFFRLIEIKPEEQIWYRARVNPYYQSESRFFPQELGRGDLLFNSLKNAFDYFFEWDFPYLKDDYLADLLIGEPEFLSPVPSVFRQIISESPHLHYRDKSLSWDDDVTQEELFQLSGLLREPFIELQEKRLEESDLVKDSEITQCRVDAASAWEPVTFALQELGSEEAVRASLEYQEPFIREASDFQDIFYFTLLEYFQRHLPALDSDEGPFFWEGKPVKVFVKATEVKRSPNGYIASVRVGLVKHRWFGFRAHRKKEGETALDAIIYDFENWVEEYGNQLIEAIRSGAHKTASS